MPTPVYSKVYFGSVHGQILHVKNAAKEPPIVHIPSDIKSEVTALNWDLPESTLYIGYKTGEFRALSISENCHKFVSGDIKLHGNGTIIGVAKTAKDKLIIAQEDGTFNIVSTLLLKQSTSFSAIKLADGNSKNSILRAFKHHTFRDNIVATGGDMSKFRLWDVNTQECVFEAKSLPNDELNLPVSLSVRDVCFLREEDTSENVVVTKEGRVLLYDSRIQRRPVLNYVESKACYTCVCKGSVERQCLTGTTKGYLQVFDLKMPKRCLKTITSFSGSVTDVSVCNTEPSLVATCSLDRYFRIHNTTTKQLIAKMYMKCSLSKMQIL